MSFIARVHGRQILDSCGHPTVEVDVVLASGAFGRAAVPVGASTGRYEALELRDGGDAWDGRGVRQAVANVREKIAPHVVGLDCGDQEALDAVLVGLDDTSGFVSLGANAVLGVSLAAARAAADEAGQPLWRHLADGGQPTLPIPMLNVLEGGYTPTTDCSSRSSCSSRLARRPSQKRCGWAARSTIISGICFLPAA